MSLLWQTQCDKCHCVTPFKTVRGRLSLADHHESVKDAGWRHGRNADLCPDCADKLALALKSRGDAPEAAK